MLQKEQKVGQAAARKEKQVAESPMLGEAGGKRVREGNLHPDDDREMKDGQRNKPMELEQSGRRTDRDSNEVERRRSLYEAVQLDKYSEEGLKEKIIAESGLEEGLASDPDAEFSAFAAEFEQDDDLKMFRADAGAVTADGGADELLLDSTAKRLGARREEAAQIAQA